MPPSDGIIGTIIPPLIQWSSMGRPIKSSYIKPSNMQLKVYNARAPTTGSGWSGWTWANPMSLRELNNHSLWKASTKPKHSASYYRHQPSSLTKVRSNSATQSIKMTASALTMANKDSCTSCAQENSVIGNQAIYHLTSRESPTESNLSHSTLSLSTLLPPVPQLLHPFY